MKVLLQLIEQIPGYPKREYEFRSYTTITVCSHFMPNFRQLGFRSNPVIRNLEVTTIVVRSRFLPNLSQLGFRSNPVIRDLEVTDNPMGWLLERHQMKQFSQSWFVNQYLGDSLTAAALSD